MTVIREGRPSDAGTVLALFDEAVAWLAARGLTGQWGTVPFSARPAAVAQVRTWAAAGGLRIAERDGEAAGAAVLGAAPPPVAPVAVPELYIEALVSSRRHAGRGVGAALVARAGEEARAAGVSLLRVDCWAGSPKLVAWYEAQGFARTGTYTVGGWTGQVLARQP